MIRASDAADLIAATKRATGRQSRRPLPRRRLFDNIGKQIVDVPNITATDILAFERGDH